MAKISDWKGRLSFLMATFSPDRLSMAELEGTHRSAGWGLLSSPAAPTPHSGCMSHAPLGSPGHPHQNPSWPAGWAGRNGPHLLGGEGAASTAVRDGGRRCGGGSSASGQTQVRANRIQSLEGSSFFAPWQLTFPPLWASVYPLVTTGICLDEPWAPL